MERKDLEGLVRQLVTDVVARVDAAAAAPVAPTRHETEPLSPEKPAASGATATAAPASPTGAAPAAAAGPAPLSRDLRVVIGSDHGGFALKEQLVSHLHALGYAVIDVGTHSTEAVDYPDFAKAVAQRVARGECDRGIVIDGAGIGSGMACNKVAGVRAAVCHDLKSVLNSRDHNDANVLSLGSGVVSPELAREMVATWLKTPFGAGRHSRRIAKINELDRDRTRA